MGTTMRSFRPAMPSAAVAASAMTSGGNTATASALSANALRLLLWCGDSVKAGARGVARFGSTCMSLQPVSQTHCNGNSMRTNQSGISQDNAAKSYQRYLQTPIFLEDRLGLDEGQILPIIANSQKYFILNLDNPHSLNATTPHPPVHHGQPLAHTDGREAGGGQGVAAGAPRCCGFHGAY